ncbi:hypothetical protein WA1_23975 [Scytonema hofmannii PCC 7110]|uniref:Uncharacterized protein n=2 Tax=Scytonema hofmannii TaxID=34078 RepID=A0A139X7U5_9CYAN|nr:hypothetical protein WA1_23975 [Scytonema hofmannii PCC 7110]
MICASEHLTLGEATEEALVLWVNIQKEKIGNLSKTKTDFSKVSKTKSRIYEKDNSFIQKEEVCV